MQLLKKYCIETDRLAIRYIRNLTQDDVNIFNEYYKDNETLDSINMIKPDNIFLTYEAVGRIMNNANLIVLRNLPHMSDELQLALFEYDKRCVGFIQNPCTTLKLRISIERPRMFRQIQNPTNEDRILHDTLQQQRNTRIYDNIRQMHNTHNNDNTQEECCCTIL